MTITLGLNISSSKAQTQLGRASDELRSVFERLSSGQRINRASDDAAGLAIADSLNADARVYNQGVRNLNDGISVLNISDGALQELTNITFRLTELAEQAANGTLGISQRASLDEEAQALKAEYFRISKSTEFNGRKLFEGSYGELRLQAGYGLNASIGSDLGGAIGTGEFELDPYLITPGDSGATYTVADFNGDGNLDIYEGAVHLGDGSGQFTNVGEPNFGFTAGSVATGDFNGDGIYDLAVNEAFTGNISIFSGNGDGTFQESATF